jgi:hypothetical protein
VSTAAYLLLATMTAASLATILRLVRRGQLKAKYSLLWLSVGVGLILLLAIPGSIDWVSERVGIYYPPALYFAVAIALLFFVVVHLSYELSRLENRSRTLAEEIALLVDDVRRLREEQRAFPPAP